MRLLEEVDRVTAELTRARARIASLKAADQTFASAVARRLCPDCGGNLRPPGDRGRGRPMVRPALQSWPGVMSSPGRPRSHSVVPADFLPCPRRGTAADRGCLDL
jgi:hypothetical protein